MKRKARKVCKSQWMFWLIVILVFLNTIVLATEHHNQPVWLDDFQVPLLCYQDLEMYDFAKSGVHQSVLCLFVHMRDVAENVCPRFLWLHGVSVQQVGGYHRSKGHHMQSSLMTILF